MPPQDFARTLANFWGLLEGKPKNIYFCSPKHVCKKSSETAKTMPFQTQRTKNRCFSQDVEYVECVLGMFLKNVLLSAVMLNMWIILNVFWTYRPFQVHPREEKKKQHSTLQLWEAHFFQKYASFNWNVEYVECVLGGFPKKSDSFSCHVEDVDYVECFLNLQALPGAPPTPPPKKNIQHYSCEKQKFFKNVLLSTEMLNMLNVFLECFRKNVLLSGEILNMLNAFGTYRPLLNEANKFQKHSTYSTFPQKKHIWGERLSNISTYSTFPQKEAHFLQKKNLLSAVMLNVVSPSGIGVFKRGL